LSATSDSEGIFFELDRFERTADDRLELSGRWYGVRGRRFVRPTLTLMAGEEEVRALADLEHKPWAAQDGADWNAAFTCEAAEVADALLAVAPDIAVKLPSPGANGASPQRLNAVPKPRRRRSRAKSAKSAQTAEAPPAKPRPSARQQQLERLRQEVRALREQLDQSQAETEEVKAALARRSSTVQELREALTEREAALEQREAELADREAALEQRDVELEERTHALSPAVLARARDPRLAVRMESPARHPRNDATVWFQRVFAVVVLLVPVLAVLVLTKAI
jgi:hypothetical protein